MSYKVIEKVLAYGPHNCSQRLMLVALATHADEDGRCWPGATSLAEKCCTDRRGAQRTLRALEDAGWISTVTGGGRSRTNHYRIDLTHLTKEWLENHGSETTVDVDTAVGEPVTAVDQPRLTVVGQPPEPSREPSIEPSLLSDLDLPAPAPVPRKRATSVCIEGFDAWYSPYPRHEKVGDARKAYAAAVKKPGVTPALLLEALLKQKPGLEAREKQYRPLPATWLRAESWSDEAVSSPVMSAYEAEKKWL